MDVIEVLGGVFSGAGHGIFTTQDGDSVAWKAYSFGKSETGKSRSLSIIQFRTASQRLSRMNGSIAVAEGITDSITMELNDTGYEWK